jgi:hypothetical protein
MNTRQLYRYLFSDLNTDEIIAVPDSFNNLKCINGSRTSISDYDGGFSGIVYDDMTEIRNDNYHIKLYRSG